MSNIRQVQMIAALDHQSVTHPGIVISDTFDTSEAKTGIFFCFHAGVEASANTNPPRFLIQASDVRRPGSEFWTTLATHTIATAAPASESPSAKTEAGENVLTVASTTGFAAGDTIYVQETVGGIGKSEWHQIGLVVADTSITLLDPMENTKNPADVIWSGAQIFRTAMDLSTIGAIRRARVIFEHAGAISVDAHIKSVLLLGQ